MAWSTCHISLAVLATSLYYICMSTSSSTTRNNYPPGSLACKTYEMTKMDCSTRDLLEVPLLDQHLTTILDLSRNHLKNITGAPFEKLHLLLVLDLSLSEIAWMSSTAFKGLKSLEKLNLDNNYLADLPKDIFADLFNLLTLSMYRNKLKATPRDVLTPLNSLHEFTFGNIYEITFQMDLSGFQKLTNLNKLLIHVSHFKKPTSNNILQPLCNLPWTDFRFVWWQLEDDIHAISNMFAPLTNISTLMIVYEVLPAMRSLDSCLQNLTVLYDAHTPELIDSNSLQVLQKWNTSLKSLSLPLVVLKRIEDYTFQWIPNLKLLNLTWNKINHLAKEVFYGLRSLIELDLSHNLLTKVPSDALEVFSRYTSLQYLDLSSNKLGEMIDQVVFSGLSNLTVLNLETSYDGLHMFTNWTSSLHSLKDLTLTCTDCSCAHISIESYAQPSSLQKLQISGFSFLSIATPLCSLFPNLEVTSISLYEHYYYFKFPLLQAIQGCYYLKELDLSGISVIFNDIQHLNITLFSLETFKLAYSKLTSVTLVFLISAPKLKHLDLAGNLLTTIDSEIAHRYPGLNSINLCNNKLTSLSGLEYLTLLQDIKAARNEITEVPNWLLSKTRNLNKFDLNNNPFQCTCAVEPFRKWVLSDKQTLLQPGLYVCATPESLKGMSITAIELDCRPKTAFYLSITIPSVLFFCIFIIVLFHYRWHIKYKLFLLYRNYHPFPDPVEDFEMLQLQYHAYVAYNENSAVDDAWVMNELQLNMEEGPEPMQLCIKSRDFTPGHFLLDSIDQSIRQSHKTILVLSPSFVESEWCYQEMQMAQMRLLDDNLDVLVLVLLNDIPENKMTLLLRQILCRKDYLKWPKDRAGQNLFWQRLREELKAPVQVDRCFQL